MAMSRSASLKRGVYWLSASIDSAGLSCWSSIDSSCSVNISGKHHEIALVVGHHVDEVFDEGQELLERIHAALHVLHGADPHGVRQAAAIALLATLRLLLRHLGIAPHQVDAVAQRLLVEHRGNAG